MNKAKQARLSPFKGTRRPTPAQVELDESFWKWLYLSYGQWRVKFFGDLKRVK